MSYFRKIHANLQLPGDAWLWLSPLVIRIYNISRLRICLFLKLVVPLKFL